MEGRQNVLHSLHFDLPVTDGGTKIGLRYFSTVIVDAGFSRANPADIIYIRYLVLLV